MQLDKHQTVAGRILLGCDSTGFPIEDFFSRLREEGIEDPKQVAEELCQAGLARIDRAHGSRRRDVYKPLKPLWEMQLR